MYIWLELPECGMPFQKKQWCEDRNLEHCCKHKDPQIKKGDALRTPKGIMLRVMDKQTCFKTGKQKILVGNEKIKNVELFTCISAKYESIK